MEDRSVNTQGSITGAVNTGDNSHVSSSIYQSQKVDLLVFARTLLSDLSERYPQASKRQKITVLEMELQQKLDENPSLRERFWGALKSGSYELASVLTDNPFVSVPLETVRGWLEAGE